MIVRMCNQEGQPIRQYESEHIPQLGHEIWCGEHEIFEVTKVRNVVIGGKDKAEREVYHQFAVEIWVVERHY